MNDAEYAEQKGRVDACFAYWLPIFGLDRWRVYFDYERCEGEAIDDGHGGSVSELFHVLPQWQYLAVRFTAYLETIERLATDRAALDWHVVHELCHCFVSELRPNPPNDDAERDRYDHEERVCSSFAAAILRARDAGPVRAS